jgi:hypothetical protein
VPERLTRPPLLAVLLLLEFAYVKFIPVSSAVLTTRSTICRPTA